jgi:hypothetical protein
VQVDLYPVFNTGDLFQIPKNQIQGSLKRQLKIRRARRPGRPETNLKSVGLSWRIGAWFLL